MMTQSHALLGLALFGKPGNKARSIGAVVGGLLPDTTMIYMYVIERVRGNSPQKIFDELYFSKSWQEVFAINNSAPVFAAIALGAFLISRFVGWVWGLAFAFAMGLSALLHALLDLPLHHDDGHPHFWPFTDWIYESPVSYWDPKHHGVLASNLELILILGVTAFLFWKFRAIYERLMVATLIATYVGMVLMFKLTFG